MGRTWEKEHLWLYLLAQDFDPSEYAQDMRLGRNMFARPNCRAFAVIALFLFTKLDEKRAKATFRTSLSGAIPSHQFRKQCCDWLREISNQKESALPNITPSSLIAPVGPKYSHLLYQFARHVMTEEMKKLSIGTGIPFAEAVRLRPEDMYIAKARHRVAYNKLLEVLQKGDFVIQEYEKKSQVLIKEIQEIKYEYALKQIQSLRMKQNDQNKSDTIESIRKVRSMWAVIMETLTSLKQDKEIVDSVLENCIHQCVLDGTDVVLRVPRLFAHRMESDENQSFTANVYEDGKLNFLAVIQLLNEALKMLRDEHCQAELVDLHRIENMVTSCNNALQNLNTKRLEREQQRVAVRESISRKEEDWEMKWKTFLGQHPFNLIVKEDLELDSTASPQQSSGLPEEDENSDVHQCVAFSGICDTIHGECYEKDQGALETVMDKSSPPPKCDLIQHVFLSPPDSADRISSVSSELSEVSENRDLLTENNLHTETCEGNKKPVPPKVSKNGKEEFPISEMQEGADKDVSLRGSSVEEDLLEKARDELAEEIANAVVSQSPDNDEEKGMTFDSLISSLCSNPFITRKEIPRTPENLLTEIRSSWRKAIQTEGSSSMELSSTEVMIQKVPVEARPIMEEATNSSYVCSVLASPVSDSVSSLSEKNSQSSFTESSPQEQVRISHVIESSDSKTSETLESERTEAQELDCTALSGSSVEDLKQALQDREKSMNIPDICLEDSSRTNVQPPDHSQCSSMDSMLCRNMSSLLSSFGCETAHMGIWNETLPEYDSMELSTSSYFESDIMDSAIVTGDSENQSFSDFEKSQIFRDIKKSDLDLQSPFNSHKMLKKTASEIKEELHQTHNGSESEICRSDLSPAPQEGETNKLCCPVVFSLDEEFTKTPLSKFSERQYSVSSLLIPSEQLQEMASMAPDIPLDLLHKLNEKNN